SDMHKIKSAFFIFFGAAALVSVTMLTFAILDGIPRFLTGDEKEKHNFDTVEEAEKSYGARISLPFYFPEKLKWPPSSVQIFRKPYLKLVTMIAFRDKDEVALILYQAPDPHGDFASFPQDVVYIPGEDEAFEGGVIQRGRGVGGKQWLRKR
ncbi:MAG: hypothetical protein FJ088_13710, partial [Deltaproteobacteria bacterium]|nr:hypothetical protein [Deltaproteobacteria bacterium]